MAIVSSVIASVSPQRDGRRWVREVHIDQVGIPHERNWLAGAGDDLNAALAAYAVIIAQQLQDDEIAANVATIAAFGSLASPSLTYSTGMQNFAGLRAAYRTATQVQAIMMGDFLSGLTDGQLQTAFGFTAGQVTTLRANKLTPAATAAATIRASTGQ